jgi:hypothetical protein
MIVYIVAICIGLTMDNPRNIAIACLATTVAAVLLAYYFLVSQGFAQNPNTPVLRIILGNIFDYLLITLGIAFLTSFVRTRFFSS